MAIRVRGQQTAASSPSSSSSLLVNLGQTTLKVDMEKGVGVTKKGKSGRKNFTETRHPVYKGVRQRSGKWVYEMRQPDHNKSRVWLGTFTCPETAARAYDLAAFALKGESAELNFPDEVQKSLPSACRSDLSTISLPAALRISTMVNLEEQVDDDVGMSRKVYVDEEELFNMPVLLDSMAEGLILTPPAMQKGFNWDRYDFEIAEEFSLWSD